ncbi:MAG TPA: tetratricopeptide repeat protein [Pirellulales bacterium]
MAERRRRWQFNTRRLLRTAVLVALLAPAAYFWHAYQVRRNANTLLQRAADRERAEDWQQAAQELRHFLRLRPGDTKARLRLADDFGRAATTRGDKQRAVQLYAVAISLAPTDLEWRRRHLKLLLELGDHEAALQSADELLGQLPQDAAALRVKALALHERYQIKNETSEEKVQRALLAAHEADPKDVEVATHLARFYRNELRQPAPDERARRADEVMDRLVAADRSGVQALLARYLYRSEFGLPGAEADLHAAEAADGDHTNASLAMAAGLHAQDLRQWQTARECFARLIRLAPAEPQGYSLLGQTYAAEDNLDEALRAWKEGLKATGGNDLRLQAQLASAHLQRNEFDDAQALMDQMERQVLHLFGAEQTQWLAALYSLRADSATARDQFGNAVPLLKRVLELRQGGAITANKAAGDHHVWMQLGKCYGRLRMWDHAAAAYQSAAELQPRDAEAHLAAAHAWEQAGWLDEALRHYEEGLALDPQSAAGWESFVNARLRQQVLLPPAKRDWRVFEDSLSKSLERLPDSTFLKLLAAEYELVRGQTDLAARLFGALEPAVIESPSLAGRLIFNYERTGAAAKADRLLEQLRAEHGETLAVLLLEADLLYRRNREAEAAAALARGLAGLAVSDRRAVRYRLALLHLAGGNQSQAREALETLVQEDPEDVLPLQLLVELDLESGKVAEARRRVDQLEASSRVDAQTGWRFYRAQCLLGEASNLTEHAARRTRIDEARRLQRDLEALRPYWPPSHLLKARVAQMQARPDDDTAIQAYAQALRLGERRVAVYQEMIALLLRQNRIAEAGAYLDQLRQAADVPPELASLAMAADLRQGNVGQAVEIARREMARNPDDALAHVRLGQLLSVDLPPEGAERVARLAEAEAELRRAWELATSDPRTWSALLAFYHQTAQSDAARALLKQIEDRSLLSDQDRPFFLAQGYALLGDTDRANTYFLAAVDANPQRAAVLLQAAQFFFRTDPQRSEQYLRRVIALEPGAGAAERMLATLLATRAHAESELDEVWTLLDRAGGGAPEIADQRLKAILLLRRGGVQFRDRARQVLESLVSGANSAAPIDRLLLARLYEAQGQWSKAREQLELLADRDRAEPAHLAAFADHLLRTSQKQPSTIKKAAELVDRLAALEPETSHFRTLSLRVRLLAEQGETEQAPALVEAFLAGQPQLSPPQRADLLGRVARLYASLDLTDPAEAAYRQAFAAQPTAYVPLAIWLARHGRAHEGIELCLAARDTEVRVAVALAAVITVGTVEAEDRRRAEPLIAAALADHPDDRLLLFGASAMHAMQGNNEEAVRLLRQMLALDPKNVASLNNMALLLSQRPDTRREALEYIERALQIGGMQAELLDTKGWVLLQQQEVDEAASLFKDALALSPTSARHRFHLALSLQYLGKTDDARQAFEEARQSNLAAELLPPAERQELLKLEANVR